MFRDNITVVSQNNFFSYYRKNNDFHVKTKDQILNLAQNLKQSISKSSAQQGVILLKLNDIATRIQKRLNRADLKQDNINAYKDELRGLLREGYNEELEYNINIYIKCCVLLSKHDTENETKYNYFGVITNKTKHLAKLSETNENFTNIEPLKREDVSHLLGDIFIDSKTNDIYNPHAIRMASTNTSVSQTHENEKAKKARVVIQNLLCRQKLLAEIKLRKRIHLHMKTVSQIYKNGVPTAECINRDDTWLSHDEILREFRKIFGSGIPEGIGNCYEIAITLYVLIMTDPEIPKEIKENTFIGKLVGGRDDHVVVVSGGFVADGWLKFVNLKRTPGYRRYDVPAIGRDVGFLGTTHEYLDFLRDHEDGAFVKRWSLHQIEKYPIPNRILETYRDDLNIYFMTTKNPYTRY